MHTTHPAIGKLGPVEASAGCGWVLPDLALASLKACGPSLGSMWRPCKAQTSELCADCCRILPDLAHALFNVCAFCVGCVCRCCKPLTLERPSFQALFASRWPFMPSL